MKITLKILTLGTLLISTANANFIAGWDFSNVSGASDLSSFAAEYGSGTFSTSNFTQQSDIDPFGGLGATRGDFGTFEAGVNTGFGATPNNPSIAFDRNLSSANSQSFQLVVDGAHSGSSSFSFTASVGTFESFQFQHAQGASDYSFNLSATAGATTLDLGSFTPGSGFAFASIDSSTSVVGGGTIGSQLDNSNVTFTFDVSGNDAVSNATGTTSYDYSSALLLDNVTFAGTVVPEPSTYAAIFGAAALAFVAIRRRRKQS